jgi:glycosyltransferase involved in cell wall biosynthesis
MINKLQISIIITLYNNEESIAELLKRISLMYNQFLIEKCKVCQLIIVDDGSIDNSLRAMQEETKKYSEFEYKIIKLTRNFGSYNSFLAGMAHADGECCIYLHADLQDPPELIPKLLENYEKGFKLVIANRQTREDSSILSTIYHWVIKKYGINDIPSGGFDLILFDKSIKDEIVKISEKNTNNVYLITWLGHPYVNIPYTRSKRQYGKSQWQFWSKVRLFVDSIFSFTSLPIFIIRFNTMFSFVLLLIISILFNLNTKFEINLIFLLVAVMFFILSLSFNITIEYLLRIHETVRNRPSYVVGQIINK